ncbi:MULTISPECIES: hypothetical protein [Catenuloplanes]|uniref:Uncharacterized protein n=1 Tax=Catenuloplanes niger TaxID=587534 RepID=A0AAE3ZMC9_9ACTN|nr:hypothetical protein [Catenuloplanes niger]MDR7321381.1 hypothetical protein [Catenuloplanes niger]
MTHELRRLLEEELAGETPPPLGDVVRVSVDSGRRVRRRRRWFAGAGGGTAAAVLAVAGLVALGTPTGSTQPPTAESSPALTAAAPPEQAAPATPGRCATPSANPSPAAGDPRPADGAAGPATKGDPGQAGGTDLSQADAHSDDRWGSGGLWMVDCTGALRGIDLTAPVLQPASGLGLARTTPSAALALLSSLVPKGAVDGLAYRETADSPPGSVYVQMYLNRGDGAGMIRLYLAGPEKMTAGLASRMCVGMRSCVNMPGTGLLVVENNPDECTLFQTVSLYRADGVVVSLMLGDCLMWDGRQNPPGQVVLTLQEAVTVVLDPQWGPQMPIELIKSGATDFPKLDTIVGG